MCRKLFRHLYTSKTWPLKLLVFIFACVTLLQYERASVNYFQINNQTSYEYKIVPDTDYCRKRPPVVLALVLSSAQNFAMRQTIRNTWANSNVIAIESGTVSVFFIMSTTKNDTVTELIYEESETHEDIILTDLEETYDNLVYKVYASFGFHSNFCPEAQHFLKIDDDVLINLDRMIYFLNSTEVTLTNIHCFAYQNGTVFRDPKHKWYVSYSDWSKKSYPVFCAGPMYLVGKYAAVKIYRAAGRRKLFRLEDVFFTGIIAEEQGLKRHGWNSHIAVRTQGSRKLNNKCDSEGEPLLFAAHSFNSPKLLENGFEKMINLKCLPNK